jgi:hypothetical protein
MDSGQVPPPSYQAGPEIPTDIFHPLLAIAQRQYDPNDVRKYYLIMLRHLRRMGTSNADAAYSLMTPVSDRKASLPFNDGSCAVPVTGGLTEDHISPKTVPSIEEPAFEPSYEPGQNEHLQIGSSTQQIYPVMDEGCRPMQVQVSTTPPMMPANVYSHVQQQGILMTAANTSPLNNPQSHLHNDIQVTGAEPIQLGLTQQVPQSRWSTPEDFDDENNRPPLPPRFAPTFPLPNHPQYNMMMGNHVMPAAGQFHPPPQQQQMYQAEPESILGPLGSSFGISQLSNDLINNPYLPMIDVIPSRKRRALHKGVRRITQSIPLPRQSL